MVCIEKRIVSLALGVYEYKIPLAMNQFAAIIKYLKDWSSNEDSQKQ